MSPKGKSRHEHPVCQRLHPGGGIPHPGPVPGRSGGDPGQVSPREITELCLDQEELLPLHSDTLAQRNQLEHQGDFSDPMFRYARQFAQAEIVVVGAPYWEYQFPALLRCYIEHISVNGLTFAYGEDGRPHGLWKGERIFYITTAGGPILDRNCGFDYLKTLFSNMMSFTRSTT